MDITFNTHKHYLYIQKFWLVSEHWAIDIKRGVWAEMPFFFLSLTLVLRFASHLKLDHWNSITGFIIQITGLIIHWFGLTLCYITGCNWLYFFKFINKPDLVLTTIAFSYHTIHLASSVGTMFTYLIFITFTLWLA